MGFDFMIVRSAICKTLLKLPVIILSFCNFDEVTKLTVND